MELNTQLAVESTGDADVEDVGNGDVIENVDSASSHVEVIELSNDLSDFENRNSKPSATNTCSDEMVCTQSKDSDSVAEQHLSLMETDTPSDSVANSLDVPQQPFSWKLPHAGDTDNAVEASSLTVARSEQGTAPVEGKIWPFPSEFKQRLGVENADTDISRDTLDDESKQFDGSWPCSEQCSQSQSPVSYIVQLNDDSECSLQSLPPGHSGCTGFKNALDEQRGAVIRILAEEDSRCSKGSDRCDGMDLLMEVETGSTHSGVVSQSESDQVLTFQHPKSHMDSNKSQKTGDRAKDKGLSSASRSRIRKRISLGVVPENEPSDGHVTSQSVFEYQWPLGDKSADWYLLQEHISDFLGIVSFKRKYPEIYRRTVDINERQFLQDNGVVTEMQCDLGLTALLADEVYDIMERDYPDKFEEYTKVIHRKEKQKTVDQMKAFEVPTEKNKLEILIKKSIKSAADFNSRLMRELRQERQAFFDLQSYELNYPRKKMRVLPPEVTKIGTHPVAVIPGQFQDYYKRYTSVELNYFPINTAVYSPNKLPSFYAEQAAAQSPTAEGAENEDSKLPTTIALETAAVTAADVDSEPLEDEPKPISICENENGNISKTSSFAADKKMCDNSSKCIHCGQTDVNKLGVEEDLVCCAVCFTSGHPSCLELTKEMIPIIKTYAWQCMDCKTCVKCMKPHDEEKMMFCDHCDRGYHTFCVGLKVIPAGRWECPSCIEAVTSPNTPRPKRGRPFKHARPQMAVTQ